MASRLFSSEMSLSSLQNLSSTAEKAIFRDTVIVEALWLIAFSALNVTEAALLSACFCLCQIFRLSMYLCCQKMLGGLIGLLGKSHTERLRLKSSALTHKSPLHLVCKDLVLDIFRACVDTLQAALCYTWHGGDEITIRDQPLQIY